MRDKLMYRNLNKMNVFLFVLLLSSALSYAQKTPKPKEPAVACNGTADNLSGKYTDHTNPKYPWNLKASSAAEKTTMLNQLIAIEKLEEKSRTNFQLTGCVARVSFSNLTSGSFAGFNHTAYEYQLAAYQNVCHVTEHVVKTVSEYRTVLRVDVNPKLVQNFFLPAGTGGFFLTGNSMRYEIPIDARSGPNYNNDQIKKPSAISQYITERDLLSGRSDSYKDKHGEFLKFVNGDGYVENSIGAKWFDRRYLIKKAGIPILVPVTRKKFLEDMLAYLEIEKDNFYYSLNQILKDNASNTSDFWKQRYAVIQADKEAYPKLYDAKKAKINQFLTTKDDEWLQKQAIVESSNQTYDANQRLADIGKFYDKQDEYKSALYVYNPEYFKINANQPAKPVLMEVQFRYELSAGYEFSQRLIRNFEKNFDMDALKKMVE